MSFVKLIRYVFVSCNLFYICVAITALLFIATKPSSHCAPYSVFKRKTSEVCCTCYSDESAPTQVLSKELVIRRVYFDPRRREGYCNSVVFLLEAKGTMLNSHSFLGCRVGQHLSYMFHFRTPLNYKWVQVAKHATSTLAIIDCYNIPEVSNGDPASLHYKTSTGVVVQIHSQRPLLVPEATATANPSSVTAVVCVGMIRSGAHSPSEHRMLYHWLRYQKVIGVDHVHMIVEDSFVRAGGLKNEVTQQAIREGYLSIDFWPNWLNVTEVYNSQQLAYQDCLYRFQGVYDYIIYADSDDFFVPGKNSKSIKHYLLTWCSGEVATCRFGWQQLYPDCGWDPNSIGADGNFTAAITYREVVKREEPKSAHQLKALMDAGTHYAVHLYHGFTQTIVPDAEAYFAHVRFGLPPNKGC